MKMGWSLQNVEPKDTLDTRLGNTKLFEVNSILHTIKKKTSLFT